MGLQIVGMRAVNLCGPLRCLVARTDTVAHDCRSDAEIAILQTVDTTDCMAYCSADQSADVVTAQVTDCQCVLSRQC